MLCVDDFFFFLRSVQSELIRTTHDYSTFEFWKISGYVILGAYWISRALFKFQKFFLQKLVQFRYHKKFFKNK